MSPLLRSGRAILALALVLLSPGLEPYAAAAGNIAVGARVTPGSIAAPAAVPGLGAVSLPASALSLSPNLAAGAANAGVALKGAALPGSQAVLPNAAIPAGVSEARASAEARLPANDPHFAARTQASPATAGSEGAPAVSARSQLSAGAGRIAAAAAPSASVETGKAALDGVFSGSAKLSDHDDIVGPSGAGMGVSPGSALGKSDGRQAPQSRPEEPRSPQQPRQSLGRSARVGFIAAVVPLAITFATMAVASVLGYHFHAGYQSPVPAHLTAVNAAVTAIAAAVMAPVSEEMIFRGGIMGGIRKMTARIPAIGTFWIPAVLSSLVFVAVHEMSDPVLFATRLVHSLILSYAFHKEGYTGSMFAHAFFNGLLVMPVVLGVLLPGALGSVAAFGLVPASVYLAWKAWKNIRAESPDKKSGRLVAYELSPKQALLLAAALMAGFFFLMPNIIWPIGAIGWAGYAIKRWRRG